MQKIIISNQKIFLNTLSKIKSEGFMKVHVLADFDRTLTKAYS